MRRVTRQKQTKGGSGPWSEAVRVGDPASARRALTEGPDGDAPYMLRVSDTTALRLLTIPRLDSRKTIELRIRIEFWEQPLRDWTGSHRPIPGARHVSIRYDPDKRFAEAHVELSRSLHVSEIVSKLLPAFVPTNDLSGAGFPLIAVDPSSHAGVLATLLPAGGRKILPFARELHGVGLNAADILLTGEDGPTDIASATTVIPLNREARPASTTAERGPQALVDLHVHNPIGRLLSFLESPAPRVLVQVAPHTMAIRLDVDDPEDEVEFRLTKPIELRVVRAVRSVESISLENLEHTELSDEEKTLLFLRLGELAATGVTLHSLPASLREGRAALHSELVKLLELPYAPSTGLAREKRSVAVRRSAMHHHSGYVGFASVVETQTGHRVLPRVSVIMSTIRPDRVPSILAMMAAQTYPHFEVIIVAHGVTIPDLSPHRDALGSLDFTVLDVDGSVLFGSALAEGVRRSSGDLITKLDDDDWYSPNHLWDLVLARAYSGADLVGKTTEYLYFESVDHTVHRSFSVERYHRQVAGGAMMLDRSTLDAIGGWRPTPNSTDRSILIGLDTAGGVAYRTHGLGYTYIRHSDSHTWARTESQLLNGSFEQWRGRRVPETDAVD